jgi:hypothetical protein
VRAHETRVARARPFFDNLAKCSGARAFTKGSHLGPAAPKAPTPFSDPASTLYSNNNNNNNNNNKCNNDNNSDITVITHRAVERGLDQIQRLHVYIIILNM